jgi:hypothetical protein
MLGASIFVAVGCAGNRPSSSARVCALTAADSIHLAHGPVFPDCAVDTRAQLLNRDVRIDFAFSRPATPGERCYAADIRLVVDTAGVPESGTSQLSKSTDPEFGAAVLASVPRWRYRPARKAGAPVRQVVLEHFVRATAVMSVRQGGAPPTPPSLPPSC